MSEYETVIGAKDRAAQEQVEQELGRLDAETRSAVTVDGVIAGLTSAGASMDAAKIMAPSIVEKTHSGAQIDLRAREKFAKARVVRS